MGKMMAIPLLVLVLVPLGPLAGDENVVLPKPSGLGATLDEAFNRLRTERSYADRPLSLYNLSGVLWAAAGNRSVTDALTAATRTYASAFANYPLRLYVVVGSVQGLSPGIYEYLQRAHVLKQLKTGDSREELANVPGAAEFVWWAPVTVVLAADYDNTVTGRFGERGKQLYIPVEAGEASQNLRIAAAASGLAVGIAGEFDHKKVQELFKSY